MRRSYRIINQYQVYATKFISFTSYSFPYSLCSDFKIPFDFATIEAGNRIVKMKAHVVCQYDSES